MTPPPAVEMSGIVKRFPGVTACDGVDLAVRHGEVHALLGENGAGKSTLVKVLAGLYQPDEGAIALDGQPVRIRSPRDALRRGIGVVYQRFRLSEKHTALQNVLLARDDLPLLLRRDTGRQAVAQTMERLGLALPLDLPVWQLTVGERQQLEILKTVHAGARILVLDEPTAVLGPTETPGLFAMLRRMREAGQAMIYISHKLEEVLSLADRVTVLRRGRAVATRPAADCDADELARLMVGEAPAAPAAAEPSPVGSEVLRCAQLRAIGDRGLVALDGLDLVVHGGSIHGLAGISGNGQTELMEVIAGLRPPAGGRLLIEGQQPPRDTPADRIGRGVAYVPADRHRMGTAGGLSVAENLILKRQRSPRYSRGGLIRRAAVARHAETAIAAFNIAARPDTRVATLSGGNLQKVILARETDGGPRLLLAAYPTRGLDVGAACATHDMLRRERARGAAILLVSEELEELLEVCDTLSVIHRGKIVLSGRPDELDMTRLGLAMVGERA